MRYCVEKTSVLDPAIDSPEWDKAAVEPLTFQPWKEFHQPINTYFKMLSGKEGISVLMHTDEKNLRAKITEQNGAVYTDSCMEFFLKPSPWDLNYINFEFNPLGFAHIGIGSGRQGRKLIDTDRSLFSIESIANDGDWTLKFYIPYSFLLEHFEKIASVCKANFYKCGEMTDHSHFITWSKVETENPDFHVPDFFGFLHIEEF